MESFVASTAAQAEAVYRCERGRLRVRLLLAPTAEPSLQTLNFSRLD